MEFAEILLGPQRLQAEADSTRKRSDDAQTEGHDEVRCRWIVRRRESGETERRKDIEVVAINDLGPVETNAHLLRFDSVHGYHQNLDDMFSVLRPAYLERRDYYFSMEADVFTRVIEEGQKAGLLLPGEPMEVARVVLSATNGLLPYSLSERELNDRNAVEQRIEKLSHVLLRGLRPA